MLRKILLYVLWVVLALVVLVLAVGYALPERHVATRDSLIRATSSEVFEAVSRVDDYPKWRSGVARVDVLGTSPLRWKEYSGGDVITFETSDVQAPSRFVSRIADPDLPFGGTWTFELTPEGTFTRVRITENGEVYNPIFRFMSRFVFGHTEGLESYLSALERRYNRAE